MVSSSDESGGLGAHGAFEAVTGTIMAKRRRLWTLILSGIAVVAMVVLSAGLSGFELLPGRPPLWSRLWGREGELGLTPGGEIAMALFRALFILAWLLLPLAIVYFIKSPKFRKQVLRALVSWLVFLAISYLLVRVGPVLLNPFNREGEAQLPDMPPLGEPPPLEPGAEFVANPPQWLVLALSLGLALILSALLAGVVWFIWRRSQRPAPPLERLAQEAQGALESLQAGADLRNTVMRCYFEMSRVLNEQRGIKRGRDMTPREFENRLEEAGLPGKPVRQLTWLFEQVRYGAKVPGEHEERQAIASLVAIIEACRSSP
jgi:hypothetical protein